MKLPNRENAVVPAAKIKEYLLSETHPDGRHKAKFFQAFGFSLDDSQAIENAVRQHISDHEVATKLSCRPLALAMLWMI